SKRLTIEDVKAFLRIMPEVVAKNVVEGNIVRIHGFADLFGSLKEACEGRDPRTGATVQLEERLLVKAKLSRTYKEAVKAAYKEATKVVAE
ncbi:MAG: HU family DNA-binding protein, partial [Mycoplasma sp.]